MASTREGIQRAIRGIEYSLRLAEEDQRKNYNRAKQMGLPDKYFTDYQAPHIKEYRRRLERLRKELESLPPTPPSKPKIEPQKVNKESKAVPAGATAESLTKRGYIFLEDSEWDKASVCVKLKVHQKRTKTPASLRV